MPRGIRVPVPTTEGVEDVEPMKEEELATKQGRGRGPKPAAQWGGGR